MRQLAYTEENLLADAKVIDATANTEVVDTSTSNNKESLSAGA